MARYVLDTDAVVDWLMGVPASVGLIQRLSEQGDTICTTATVVAEIFSGLRPEDTERADAFLSSCVFLPTEYDDGCRAGKWRYEYGRRGKTLSTPDMLLAATALSQNAVIVSGNLKDFPMPEVSILPLPRAKR